MVSKIIYYSLSGNTKAFAQKFDEDGYEVRSIRDVGGEVNEDFFLFTPTYNFGEVPAPVDRFLQVNHEHAQAVVSFGNMNWGAGYALAGEKVKEKYGIPLLMKIEMRGSNKEYGKLKEMMRQYGGI